MDKCREDLSFLFNILGSITDIYGLDFTEDGWERFKNIELKIDDRVTKNTVDADDFERWYSKIPQYGAAHKADMLECWKASRESMKAIKLPESKETYHMAQHCMTKMIDLNDTIRVITSAGHKVEG